MPVAPILDVAPPASRSGPVGLSPYSVTLRSTGRQGELPSARTEMVTHLAARLGVAVTFDDLGYEAEFTIVAEDDGDAVSTARRRWFYLASDLELPSWPVTDVVATPVSRTPAATW